MHIVTTLKNQIKSDRIGHAYLFCGTRGTGKTTVAKIFAKAVNCEHPVDGSPCGECAVLPSYRGRHFHECDRDRRGFQQRRGQYPGDPGGGGLPSHGRPVQGLYHRRGPHAFHRRFQRAFENAGGAAGICDLYPGHHRGPQDPGHDPVPVSAL